MTARPEAGTRVLLLLPREAGPSAIRDSLVSGGHDVTLVHSAAEALQMLARLKFGCLVADASLADGGAPDFVADCLAREASLAVVLCGLGIDARAAVQCLHAGAMDYIPDVLDPPAAEQALRDAIARRRSAMQEQAAARVLREEVAGLVGVLRQERARLQSLAVATLESLVRVVETKDPWLAGHSVRVAQLAASLAAEMGRSDQDIEAVRLAGRLHDIGMICLGDGILSKEGALTAGEFEQVKRHVTIGHQILEPLPQLGPVAAFVRGHHERWDGNGYPDRLTDQRIPWGARLIGAAEIYDALTTTRPYRTAVSPEEAVDVMRKLVGAAICPEVHAALTGVVSRQQALVFVDPEADAGPGPRAEVPVDLEDQETGRRAAPARGLH